ncbi:hypothetical protein A2U01_0011079 [Trifolium medium]|uniref:Uncharacterized protein n=1 Tax=Trifolium medium TaxID=97028 RepID=A0A392MT34_9FABA|nr:hypothetical protein [Trifolium medium]
MPARVRKAERGKEERTATAVASAGAAARERSKRDES